MGDCGGSGSGGRRTTSRILAAGALSSGDIHHLTEERTHSIRLIGRILHRLVEFLDIPTLQIRDPDPADLRQDVLTRHTLVRPDGIWP